MFLLTQNLHAPSPQSKRLVLEQQSARHFDKIVKSGEKSNNPSVTSFGLIFSLRMFPNSLNWLHDIFMILSQHITEYR